MSYATKLRLTISLAVLLTFLVCLFAFAPLLARYDARRLASGGEPIFCWSHWIGRDWEMLDGGTRIYRGFGYELLAKHRIIGSNEPVRYERGVAVTFAMPCYKRFDFEIPLQNPRTR